MSGGRKWSVADATALDRMWERKITAKAIGLKLGRSTQAVIQKAYVMGLDRRRVRPGQTMQLTVHVEADEYRLFQQVANANGLPLSEMVRKLIRDQIKRHEIQTSRNDT